MKEAIGRLLSGMGIQATAARALAPAARRALELHARRDLGQPRGDREPEIVAVVSPRAEGVPHGRSPLAALPKVGALGWARCAASAPHKQDTTH